jgi:hypothetical protein
VQEDVRQKKEWLNRRYVDVPDLFYFYVNSVGQINGYCGKHLNAHIVLAIERAAKPFHIRWIVSGTIIE